MPSIIPGSALKPLVAFPRRRVSKYAEFETAYDLKGPRLKATGTSWPNFLLYSALGSNYHQGVCVSIRRNLHDGRGKYIWTLKKFGNTVARYYRRNIWGVPCSNTLAAFQVPGDNVTQMMIPIREVIAR